MRRAIYTPSASHNDYNSMSRDFVRMVEIFYNCIGEFTAPKMDELPRAHIRIGTRKGVAISYSSSDKVANF